MTTYTSHKLTPAQLKRLSQICNQQPHLHGNALSALENKRLVERRWRCRPITHRATAAGRLALRNARSEGW